MPSCQVVGRVATPDLGGEQVAGLPPHAASLEPRNVCILLLCEGNICTSGHKVSWCTAVALRGAYGGPNTGPRRSPLSPSHDRLVRHTPHLGPTHNYLLISGPCQAERCRRIVWPWGVPSMLSVQQRPSEIPLLGSPADSFAAAYNSVTSNSGSYPSVAEKRT